MKTVIQIVIAMVVLTAAIFEEAYFGTQYSIGAGAIGLVTYLCTMK